MLLRRVHKIICLLLLAMAVTGCSYTKDLTILSRKQAVYDLDYLVNNVKAIHPDPFTRISEENFDLHVQQIKATFADKVKRGNISLAIAELLALMHDSHTSHKLISSYQPLIQAGVKLFPLKLRYKDGNIIVENWAKTLKPTHLKKGDFVISINNKPILAWIEQYYKYISAETTEQKNWQIPFFLPAYIRMSEGEMENFEVSLKNMQGETYQETVPATVYIIPSEKKKDRHGAFSYEFYDNQVCLLKAPSFRHTLREVWIKTLDELFPQMEEKGTSVLIVDLRNNGGGDGELGEELIRRTVQKPYKTPSKRMRYSKAYQKALLIDGLKERGVPAFLHLENILKLNDFHPYPVDLSKLKGEYITYDHGIAYPYKNNWNGTLVLITSHDTASAAVDLAAIVKDSQLGVIVGEETGGRPSYFSEVAILYLPNSGWVSMIASSYFERPAGYDDGHGVLPDLPLDILLEDKVLVEKISDHLNKK